MSGAKSKRWKEYKEKSEAKISTAEKKKAALAFHNEQKEKKEKQILKEMSQILQSKVKVEKK